MIIKSSRNFFGNVDIKITNQPITKTDHIKYLGVMINDTSSWSYHISFITSTISRKTGIISKLRHYYPSYS
jgi:hypothetical protein